MKISTTWTQADWNNALKKVWELSRNFEEILEFGLERGFITSSDIIHASDIYRDPNKTYDEFEIDDFIKSVPLSDLMKSIQDTHSLDDIIDELPKDEILDYYDDDELYEALENDGYMDVVKDEIKGELYEEYVDEWIEELKEQDKDYLANLYNSNPDEFHTFICDVFGSGYYDQTVVDKLMKKLKNNSYGVNYEK